MSDHSVQFLASDGLRFTSEHQGLVSACFGVRVELSNEGSLMIIYGCSLELNELPNSICDVIDPDWRSKMFPLSDPVLQ
ncbi:MAG: hypothetical protein RIQ54_623 [Candidatus Parcubacteria bacterium]|jgi:hypothetical protein